MTFHAELYAKCIEREATRLALNLRPMRSWETIASYARWESVEGPAFRALTDFWQAVCQSE